MQRMTENHILHQAWLLTSEILEYFHQREKYQNLIQDISQNRSALILPLRDQGLQFGGILILDQQIKNLRLNNPLYEMEGLSPEELKEVEEIFLDFHQINLLCLKPLIDKFPWLEICLLHYYTYNCPIPEMDRNRKNSLVRPERLKEFTEAFHLHPGFEIIRNNIGLLKDRSADYVESIRRPLEKEIENGELTQAESFIRYQSLEETSREKRLAKFVFSIICLRKAIQIFNEFLFAQILLDRFPSLESTAFLAPPQGFTDPVGTGAVLQCKLDPENSLVSRRTWVFSMEQDGADPTPAFYSCTAIKPISPEAPGEAFEITARRMDQNLNPYPNLFH
jgi:hypothetical protein